MDIAFLIVIVILIIIAVLVFWKNSSRNTMITKGQRALAVFQIVLCGGFFGLCLSNVLDIKVGLVRCPILELFNDCAHLQVM